MTERKKNRLGRTLLRPPALALALAVLLAAIVTGLGIFNPTPAPAAAQGSWGLHRIAEIRLADTEVVAYPGTNTRIAFSLHDTSGRRLTGLVDWGAVWEGADAAARRVVDDLDGRDIAIQGYIFIPIREDARRGAYRFNVRTHARNENNEPYDSVTLTVYVVGRPDYLRTYLNDTDYDAGDTITLRATLRDAGSALASFVRNATYGTGIATPCDGCRWAAADDASAAVLTVAEGSLGAGRAQIPIAANAPAGTYRIVVSQPRVDDRTLKFTVRARSTQPGGTGPNPPAGYTLSAGDRIAAGASANYRVTARSASDGTPNLDGNNGRVYVFVDGPGQDAATLSAVGADGSLTLDNRGVGSFGVSVAAGTAPTTIRLDVVGVAGTDVVTREISIGSATPPRGVTATAAVDDQGAATIVNLRWTPGAGATEQVAVVVNSDDDTDYCLETLASDVGSFTCSMRTPGQTYVGLVIGLLPDDGYALGNVVTITLSGS